MRPFLILKAIRALREGRIGDAGAYKMAALAAPAYPEVESAVLRLRCPIPNLPSRLASSAPPGSVGDCYREFVERHGIAPIAVSVPARAELCNINVVAVRYLVLHDLYHVLLGFDVSRPGELGVWSFVAAQRYCPTYSWSPRLARALYPLLEPTARSALHRARALGDSMGRAAPSLIRLELEAYWDEPLDSVRARLRLTDASTAERRPE